MGVGRWLASLAAITLAAAVAGCTDGNPSLGDDAGVADEVPVVGGTLRLGLTRLESLDPAAASPESPAASIAADLLFDGLTVMPTGADRAAPALASEWNTLDDGRTWRFVLASNARFTDGRAVTASDVEYSLERVVLHGGASLAASRLDAVNGYNEFVGGQITDLPGVRVMEGSSTTVEIVLDRPLATLPELLASPAYGVMPRGAADDPAFANGVPVGSGPFVVAARDGDIVHLARAAEGDSYVDGIDLHVFDDAVASYAAFTEGRVDWTLVPRGQVDRAAEAYGVEGFLPSQAALLLGFNLASPTFADVRFRQAIAAAIDRVAIVNAVYFGVATPLAGLVPAGVPGHDPGRCLDSCGHSPDLARDLLAQAYPDGAVPEVVFDYDEGQNEAAVAGIVEQNLELVGIPVTPRPHPPDQYGRFAVSGEQQLFRLGWLGLYPSPDAYLAPLFATGSPDNVFGFSDAAVDGLLAQMAAAADPDARQQLAADAEAAILAQAPVVPIAQFRLLTVAAPGVRDLVLSVASTFDAERVWLAR
ncbi:MAG: ABC transporter substrate-binding protein [Acidimicrobiales bacterium]